MSHWSPTHVQVTVVRAKNLIPKSKNGETNNAYVTIQLGKEKFETSVAEKTKAPEWNEECDLRILDLRGVIILTVYHKHTIGTDDFLGRIELPLDDLNFYDRPKNIWFPLRSKRKDPAKEEKYRGEIQVRLNFYVQNIAASTPNLAEGAKKERSNSFKSKISNQLGKTLPNRKHGGSVMDIRTPGLTSGFFGSLKRSSSKTHVSNGNSPFMEQLESPVSKPQDSRTSPIFMKSSSRLHSSDKAEEVSMASSSYDERPAPKEIEIIPATPPPAAKPVTKSSSFSKTKSLVSSFIHSGLNGSESGASLAQSDREPESRHDSVRGSKFSSMTVETKRQSGLIESEKSPKLNGDAFHSSKSSSRFDSPVLNTSVNGVSRDLLSKYGHLDTAELICKLGDADRKIGEQQTEIDRLQAYIESLLLRVMDTAPKILQSTGASATGTTTRR